MPAEIPQHILQRKGSTTTAGVPKDVLKLLNEGRLETVNLSEWLVVDQAALARKVLPQFGWDDLVQPTVAAMAALKTPTAPKKLAAVGVALSSHFAAQADCLTALDKLCAHTSDVVRSWGAFMLGQHPALGLPAKLKHMRRLAADPNMGVREGAWMAVRESLMADLPAAWACLAPFVKDADPNVRRFASELTRPRGVWCRHITTLKDDPSPALPLLEPLRSDPSKYVRDSVANWLNDASKTRPDWVRTVCKRWSQESPTPETAYIVRRALRTIG
jgi:3-methyladenine DNA glycosylase AlkC